ncbi:DUF3696 domain-containing protein [Methylocucumis oryzae]|uniref:DUF3696 domain-containing protein n=1 Tax=Methylocucumis oryzae TaxID=1632867 RepID=UPI0034E00976
MVFAVLSESILFCLKIKRSFIFFDVDATPPQPLSFTETGGIASWPRGFFDQYQLDITALTRVRRRKE